MKLLIKLMCVISIVCLPCCANTDNKDKVISRSAFMGPFEIIVELMKNSNNSIIITRKLKYEGDQDIQIHHANPLISVVVSSKGSEVAHSFDSIELKTDLKPNETLTYGDPIMVNASQGNSIVSVLANFEFEGSAYSIPLEFEY